MTENFCVLPGVVIRCCINDYVCLKSPERTSVICNDVVNEGCRSVSDPFGERDQRVKAMGKRVSRKTPHFHLDNPSYSD